MFVKFQDLDPVFSPDPDRSGTKTLHALPKERSSEFCSASCLNVAQCDGSHCWALALIESRQGQKATTTANVPRRGAAEIERIVRDTERRLRARARAPHAGTRPRGKPRLDVVGIYHARNANTATVGGTIR